MTSTIIPTGIPIPGTPAYWTAQREGVALVDAYAFSDPDPFAELDALRRIAAHGFAARIMAAHRKPVASWIRDLERIVAAIGAACFGEDDTDPDAPPPGDDWCPRGCQPLYGMECGICGHDGPGVWASEIRTVAEYCCHCRARTRQSLDGICELCGKDAETPDAPALPPSSCFWDCGPVSQDTQCRLCRDLERHAQGAAVQAGHEDQAAPAQLAPGQGLVDGER